MKHQHMAAGHKSEIRAGRHKVEEQGHKEVEVGQPMADDSDLAEVQIDLSNMAEQYPENKLELVM